MKRLVLSLGGVLLLGIAGASTAAAQCAPTTNNFCLSGVGNGNSLDGIYVSPYQAVINGVPTYVICDDFEDDVQVLESWTASSGTVGSPKWLPRPHRAIFQTLPSIPPPAVKRAAAGLRSL